MKSTAKFILSKKKLVEQFNLIEPLADTIAFSFKTNQEVGQLLEKTTPCLFSVHSHELLKKIKDKSRVLFFAQAWDDEELNDLIKSGIQTVVVDNEADLTTLLQFLKNTKNKINLFLRMRMKENTVLTGKHFVFGMKADQINKHIPELKLNENIKSLGIHFHRKTQNVSEWDIQDELSEALSEKTWQLINTINIGGGLPVQYKNSHPDLKPIFSKLKSLNAFLTKKNIKLVIEPGRFLSAPCIKLETTIKNLYENNIIIDTSIYNTAIDTFASHVRLKVENELEQKQGEPYTIKGSTPCSLDIFRYRVYLKNPKPGDKIIFLNAGAYNFKTDFCGLDEVPTSIVD